MGMDHTSDEMLSPCPPKVWREVLLRSYDNKKVLVSRSNYEEVYTTIGSEEDLPKQRSFLIADVGTD